MAEKTKHKVAPIAQMTVKTLGCDPKDAIRQERQVFMCRIYGEATSAKTKEARSGDAYTYLIGIFRGERPSKSDAEKAATGRGTAQGSHREGEGKKVVRWNWRKQCFEPLW